MNAQMMKKLKKLESVYDCYINQKRYMEYLKFKTRPETYCWQKEMKEMADDGVGSKWIIEEDTHYILHVLPRMKKHLLKCYQNLQKIHYSIFAPTLNQISDFYRKYNKKILEIKPTYNNVTVDVLKLCPDVLGKIGEFVGLDALKAESNENKFKNLRRWIDVELIENKKKMLKFVSKPQMDSLLKHMMYYSQYDEEIRGVTYISPIGTNANWNVKKSCSKVELFEGLISMGQWGQDVNRDLLNMKMCILDLLNRVLIKKTKAERDLNVVVHIGKKRTFNWEVGMNMVMG
jgi:hypothetical protein